MNNTQTNLNTTTMTQVTIKSELKRRTDQVNDINFACWHLFAGGANYPIFPLSPPDSTFSLYICNGDVSLDSQANFQR